MPLLKPAHTLNLPSSSHLSTYTRVVLILFGYGRRHRHTFRTGFLPVLFPTPRVNPSCFRFLFVQFHRATVIVDSIFCVGYSALPAVAATTTTKLQRLLWFLSIVTHATLLPHACSGSGKRTVVAPYVAPRTLPPLFKKIAAAAAAAPTQTS